MAGKHVKIGSLRERIAPPACFKKRAQAGANVGAKQFDSSATAKLKKAPAPAASSSCASRPPKNPSMRGLPKGRKMIAAGRGLVRIANQLAVHWQPLRLIDRHSKAERQ